MTASTDFGAVLAAWAARQPAVSGLVLIGSRERSAADRIWRPDAHSDWDFHVITSRPEIFLDRKWTAGLKGVRLQVYAPRIARIGQVPKVNAIFSEAEVDLVIIPEKLMRTNFRLVRRAGRRLTPPLRQFLQDVAVVVRPGHRFLKDTAGWGKLYRLAIRRGIDPRLDDVAVRRLADGFVCDYVWTVRKLARGELFAAQRMLHRELAETNLRLLHEWRLRRGERTFPEGRRMERVVPATERDRVAVESSLQAPVLSAALEKSARACRTLVRRLVGRSWRWPDLAATGPSPVRRQRRTKTARSRRPSSSRR